MENHLKQKDIQLFFNDGNLQSEIENLGWGGRVKDFSGRLSDGRGRESLSLKSDYCIKRKYELWR